ncbi:class F sortase [Actinophytocola xinjiangensis]|uniref:class F sortase n=1 Tax=Actinophytocola xinjiangensis TaxID=485602 RepID=UPI000A5AC008|nr:class F sortase [Actinophytocola xinjiangensis]
MAAVSLLLAALTACSSPTPSPTSDSTPREVTSTSSAPEQTTVAGLPASRPLWIDVPAIATHSSLVPLGLNDDRTVEVPPVEQPMQAGWYEHSPTPGQTGPSVVLGHVNGGGQDGIFARLHELKPGDEIRVGREDGQVARFVVDRTEQIPKKEFPADAVYGNTAEPELRLITCGGSFDDDADSYRDNIIAFATFAGVDQDRG